MATPTLISEPGVYDDLPEDLYHSDLVPEGSISSTGIKDILQSAARFAYNRDNSRPEKTSFDIGKIAHAEILGTGAEVEVLAYGDYKTQAAQKEKKAAYAAGKVPLLTHEMDQVRAMVASFRASPYLALLQPDGKPERSIFWRDEATGVMCRARFDHSNWLTNLDLKTAADASPDGFATAAARYRYNVQDVFYRRGIRALCLAGDREPEFYFAAVEKEPPYLTAAYRMPTDALDVAEELVDRALRRFAECQRTGYWPGYPVGIQTLRFPRWATYLPEEDFS